MTPLPLRIRKSPLSLNRRMRAPTGNPLQVMVTGFTEEDLTIEADPPLAGQALDFDIERVELA